MINVVIADDEENVVKLIRTLVDWNAFNMRIVGVAHSGIDALELIRKLNADLLVTDIRMPGMDGLELIAKAKSLLPNLEVIIISGYRSSALAHRVTQYQVTDFILKPVKRERLCEALNKVRVSMESSHANDAPLPY